MQSNNLFEKQYKLALQRILNYGVLRANRTDTSAFSLFDVKFVVDVSTFYPIITSKLIDLKIVNAEFEWLISGHTNIELFKKRGIKIWDAWADEDGELGPVYGYQLVNFNGAQCNQLDNVISSLREDPLGRRHILTLWNPLQLKEMRLPPCYLYFQFYVDHTKKLNVFVVQRSGDMFAGVPYDICVFTNLLGYIAQATGLTPGVISHNIVDAHIYSNHLDGVKEYLNRSDYIQPKWQGDLFGSVSFTTPYNCEPYIKIPIAV